MYVLSIKKRVYRALYKTVINNENVNAPMTHEFVIYRLDCEKERIFAQLSVEEEEDMMKFETDSETSSIAESNEEQQ